MKGLNHLNPFFGSLVVANKARKIRPGRVRRRSHFRGQQMPAVRGDGVGTLYTQQREQNTINTGRRSHHNSETPLHNNAIVLTLQNNDAALRADLVLSAGNYSADPRYAPQLITDGTANYNNDDGNPVSVTVTAEYGVDGTSNAWSEVQSWITQNGIAITTTRLEWQTNTQKMHKLRYAKLELFGDHTLDHLFPQVYYNPQQYHEKLVDIPVGFALNKQTILKYSLQPNEVVMITLWVSGIYEDNRVIEDYVRRQNSNSLG